MFFLHYGVTLVVLEFINSNIDEAKWEEKKDYWFEIFRKACATEMAFFGLASANFPTYEIVANGTYEVQNYHNNYFLVSGANSVTTEETKPAEGAEVSDKPSSYTIAAILTPTNSGS